MAAGGLSLAACSEPGQLAGGFTDGAGSRGHLLRDGPSGGGAWPAPTVLRSTRVIVAGAGVAGLAAARALRLKGVDDFAVLELEDAAGGNARGGQTGGLACPLGAHYLPLPGDDAPEVQNLLEELGLRQRVAGRWHYDERHLCHSPQERLFRHGAWQEGLLPMQDVGPGTMAQYRRFAALVTQAGQAARWTIPISNRPLAPVQSGLVAITFEAFLNQHRLVDPQLRWYLDYCCRDDYGAGLASVSAWAGIHYFAARHGFQVPGEGDSGTPREGLLTWPQGNAWLTGRLAAPLGERLFTGRVVLRIEQMKHGVEVDALNVATLGVERWRAQRAVVSLPVMAAARVLQPASGVLQAAARRIVHAPWLVANIHLAAPLHDRPGAAPSWDNVIYGAPGLGYVDAMHQSLQSVPGATVLTYYLALGDMTGGPGAGRRMLLAQPWSFWRDRILAELSVAHPDLATQATRMDITRHGHAMAVPVPRNDGQIGHWPLPAGGYSLSKSERHSYVEGRLAFAHGDWAGYSVFEEAFTLGHQAGLRAVG